MIDRNFEKKDHQVFISYANDEKDRKVAEKIFKELEAKNVRCWIASKDIPPGEDWFNSMVDAVEKSELIVLVFSSNANKSKWVNEEIKHALSKNIQIIPFRIENVPFEGGLRLLTYRQCIDAYKPPLKKYLNELVEAVHLQPEKIEEKHKRELVTQETYKKPKKKIEIKVWLKISISTVLVIALLGIVLVLTDQFIQKGSPVDIWAKFVASGWMGDGEQGTKYVRLYEAWRQYPHSPPVCVKITYTPGPVGWAGIYWQNKPDNWGDRPGENLKKSGYKKLILWARGEKGGEIVEFKAGGINAPGKKYRDSFEVSLGKVVLEKTWKQYTIDLEDEDLTSVIGGFCWVTSKTANPEGLTFYLDDIYYDF